MKEICENCKYWNGKQKGVRDLCHLSKMKMRAMSSACGLYTSSDFGCNQFKERNPDEEKEEKSKTIIL